MGGSDKNFYDEEGRSKERGSGKRLRLSERGTVRAWGGSVWMSFAGSGPVSFGGSGCVSFRGGGRKPPTTARSMHADDRKRRFGERKSLGKGCDGCSAGDEMTWNGGLTLT